jgi:nucleoside-diphosphate-sugar epimerase
MSGRDGAQRILVLGSGFVGTAVAAELIPDHEVGVRDIPDHPELARRDTAAERLIRNEVAAGATAVVNTCGRLVGTPEQMHDANVAFPTWLVRVLTGTDVRFVHLGSAAEYGDPGSADPVPETAEVHPVGVYGETKWAGSRAVLDARAAGLDAVVARGFNLVSHRLAPVSPLHQFVADVMALPPEGGEVEVWWPDTIRDHILLRDLAVAVARLAEAEVVPDIVNLCSGVGVRFGDIVEAIARRQRKDVTIRSLDRPGIPAVVGDPSRMIQHTGVRPEMSAEIVAESSGI